MGPRLQDFISQNGIIYETHSGPEREGNQKVLPCSLLPLRTGNLLWSRTLPVALEFGRSALYLRISVLWFPWGPKRHKWSFNHNT